MSAVILPFLRPAPSPEQFQAEREQNLRDDVRKSLPGYPPILVHKAQKMALHMLKRRSYDDARKIAVQWARDENELNPPPEAA